MHLTKIGWYAVLPRAFVLALIPVAGWISEKVMTRGRCGWFPELG